MSRHRGSPLKNSSSDKEAALLEQIRLLKIENETLRQFISEKGFTNVLQENGRKGNEEAAQKKARRGSHVGTAKVKSPNPQTPAGSKGCSCKGNCSTRVCGCVKKNVPCAEFCRCGNELCQNSEPDKENINDPNKPPLSKDGEESLVKLSNLTLADKQETKKKSTRNNTVNKHLEKVIKPRSIFSPDLDDNVFTFEDGVTGEDEIAEKDNEAQEMKEDVTKKSKNKKNKKADNTKANTEAVKKQSDALDSVPAGEALDDDVELEPRKKTKTKIEKGRKAARATNEVASHDNDHAESDPETTNKNKTTKKKGKATVASNKQNSRMQFEEEVEASEDDHSGSEPEPVNKKGRKGAKKSTATGATGKRNNQVESDETDGEASQGTENSEPEPEPVNKKGKKGAKKPTATGATGKRNNQVESDETDGEASQGTENSEPEPEPEPVNKKGKKGAKKPTATGAAGKRNNQVESDETDGEASQVTENSEPEPEPKQGSKKTVPRSKRATKVQTDEGGSVEMTESSSKSGDRIESNTTDKNRKEKQLPAIAIEKANPEKNTSEMNTDFDDSHDSKLFPPDLTESHNRSGESSLPLHAKGIEGFNPMKPTRQLQRSPIGPRSTLQPPTTPDPSKVFVPSPIKLELEEETVSPPAEFENAVIDWDEHQANLVKCSKCSRTFLPQRIRKHEAFCQKI